MVYKSCAGGLVRTMFYKSCAGGVGCTYVNKEKSKIEDLH
jgi:hypothetical protein